MTPLFPEKGQYILIQQGQASDCYLLCSLDCILNGGTEHQDLIRSKFTQISEGVFLRIKRTDQSQNLKLEQMKGKYIYSYDVQTDEDVIFIDNQKLEAIDKDPRSVKSNALAVKILERISSYYYIGSWDNDEQFGSIYAHNIPERHQQSSTIFVGKLLGLETTDTRDINAIVNLKAINPNQPIYISMDYANKDDFGKIHGRHALRIERISPMPNGDYEVVLVNPWDNTKQEFFTLSEIKTRHYRFAIFDTGPHKKNLINQEYNVAPSPLFIPYPSPVLHPQQPIRYDQQGYDYALTPANVAHQLPLMMPPPNRNEAIFPPQNLPPFPVLNLHANYGQHGYNRYQLPPRAPLPTPNVRYAQQEYNLVPKPIAIPPVLPPPDIHEQPTEPYIAKAQFFLRKGLHGVEHYQVLCSSKTEADAIQQQLNAIGVNPSRIFEARGFWRINCDKSTLKIDAKQCIEKALKIYQGMPQNYLISGRGPRLFSRRPKVSYYELSCSSHQQAVVLVQQLKTLGVHCEHMFETKGFWRIHCNKITLIQNAKQSIEAVLNYQVTPAAQGIGQQAQQPPIPPIGTNPPLPRAYQHAAPPQQQAAQFKQGLNAWLISPSPLSFRDWIAGLDNQKAAILSNGLHNLETQFSLNLMQQWMKPLSPIDESQLLFILSNYKVEYRGGTNSKNLLVINAITGEKEILKLEHRMGNPNTHVQLLQNIPDLQGYFVQVHFSKAVTVAKDSNGLNERCLQITDFCPGNDISSQANMWLSDAERLAAASNIYSQMARALVLMDKNATFYMDMKNSNWLLDVNGNLKIADTKSICPAQGPLINLNMLSRSGYRWLRTNYLIPPELSNWNDDLDAFISTTHAEAFMFGKNLYEFLAATPPSRTVNAIQSFMEQHANVDAYDFSAPIFQTPVGARYVLLIKHCIRENPIERFDVNLIQQAMHAIQSLEKDPQVLTTYWENYNTLNQMQNQYPNLAIEINNQIASWQNLTLNPLLTNFGYALINEAMQTYGLIIDTMQHAREQYKNDGYAQQELDKIQGSINGVNLKPEHLKVIMTNLNQLIDEAEQAYIYQQQQIFEALTHKLKENYRHSPQIRDNLAQIENRIGFYAYMPLEDINNFLRAMANAMEHSNAYANMAAQQQHHQLEPNMRFRANMVADNPYSFLAGTKMNIDQPQDSVPTNANENPPDMQKKNIEPK